VCRLLELDPRARVIASTGYSAGPGGSDVRVHGFRAVLSKPYRVEDLAATLAAVLRGR
jgi:two-component system cell cycle sensor histidine kinase/response regulator CckA